MCPNCSQELPSFAFICPHCDYDFRQQTFARTADWSKAIKPTITSVVPAPSSSVSTAINENGFTQADASMLLSNDHKLQLWISFVVLLIPGLILLVCNSFMVITQAWQADNEAKFVMLWFMGFMLYIFVQGFRLLLDICSGKAVYRMDYLENSWESYHNKKMRYYGRFSSLGKVRLRDGLQNYAQKGHWYRVTYTPYSKYIVNLDHAPDFNPDAIK